MVFGGVEEEGLDGALGVAEAGGAHGKHGIIPAPSAGPVPILPDPIEGVPHGGLIHAGARQHAEGGGDGGMVGFIFGIGVGVLGAFGEKVFAVGDGQLREAVQDLVPFFVAGQAEADAPLLGHVETPMPVDEFVSEVEGDGFVELFLCALNGRAEDVALGGFVPKGKRGHEIGGGENHVLIFFEGGPVGMGAIVEFGHVDDVRLFPEEKGADGGGRIEAVGLSHFGPAGAVVTLAFGVGEGVGQGKLVKAHAVFHEGRAAPEGEVGVVPPIHFHVRAAIPTVHREPGFGGRIFAGGLDGGEVFGEDDAAFEFVPAGVLALGEVNGTAGGPEIIPVNLGGVEDVSKSG